MGACSSCRALASTQDNFEILIVGGGNAAGYLCRELVAQGIGPGKVGIITEEPVPPYERPALTKAYLHPPGAKVRARLPGFHTCVGSGGERQDREWYAARGIRFVNGTATGVDLPGQALLVGQERYGYKRLIIATGCRALRLSDVGVKGANVENVFHIRNERDAAGLVRALESLSPGSRAVVVGGGYIGMECAAALIGWGIEVMLLVSGSQVMPRLFSPELARWIEDEYATRGVVIRKGVSVAELSSSGGRVSGVNLQSGEHIPCDLVVAGVGGTPNSEWCQGLSTERGAIAVDAFMQTSDPSVFALGDVCAFPLQPGRLQRCEHVDHARKSAAQAAKAAMGVACEPYSYIPYFYSRIFEYSDNPVVFNFFGDSSGECRTVRRGPRSIGALWGKDGRIAGCLLMGSPGPSQEDAAKLRELVVSRPPAGHPDAVFSAAGL